MALLIEHPYWIVINSIKIDTQGPRPVFWLGPVLFFSFTYCRIILAVVIVVKPLARILMSVVVLMDAQVLPLAAQWINGPEYNPAQGHATMDMDQYLILQKASLWMCFSGLAVESSGVYLFVYEACNVPEGQKFQPFKGKALTGLICVTAGVALLTGSYILAKRVNSGNASSIGYKTAR